MQTPPKMDAIYMLPVLGLCLCHNISSHPKSMPGTLRHHVQYMAASAAGMVLPQCRMLALITSVSQFGRTCLHQACDRGQLNVAKYLVKVGGKELLISVNKVGAFAQSAEYSQAYLCEDQSRESMRFEP